LSHQATSITIKTDIVVSIKDADYYYKLPQIVKLDLDDFESGKHWPHPELIMAIMNKDPNIMQVIPVTNDNEAVFMANKFIPIPIFLVPIFLADNTPKKAPPCSSIYMIQFIRKAHQP